MYRDFCILGNEYVPRKFMCISIPNEKKLTSIKYLISFKIINLLLVN